MSQKVKVLIKYENNNTLGVVGHEVGDIVDMLSYGEAYELDDTINNPIFKTIGYVDAGDNNFYEVYADEVEILGDYIQSKYWDMNKSVWELFEDVETVFVTDKYRGHKSDNGYGRYCMFVKHQNDDRYHIITICEDGLCYDGDRDKISDCIEMPLSKAYKVLCGWRDILVARDNFESLLLDAKFENDSPNIIISHNYVLEKTHK